METSPEIRSLHHARRWPYAFGLLVCVLWPLALEIGLTHLPQGEPSDPTTVQTIGHTFTGLIFLAAAYIFWRKGRAREALANRAPSAKCASLRRETLVASAVFGACSLLGLLYYGVAGAQGERHARSYIAAVPIMFFAFTPRLRSWEPGPPKHHREHA